MSETSASSFSFTDLKDINYLLHLESLKRMKDDEEAINNIVIEKANKYVQERNDYLDVFAKYVELIKLSMTRQAIEEQCALLARAPPQTTVDVDGLIAMTATRMHSEVIAPANRSQMLELLSANLCDYPAVGANYDYVSSCKSLTNVIEATKSRVESKVETAIDVGLDEIISQFDREM